MFGIEVGQFGYWVLALDGGGRATKTDDMFVSTDAAINEAMKRNACIIREQGRLDEEMTTVRNLTFRQFYEAHDALA